MESEYHRAIARILRDKPDGTSIMIIPPCTCRRIIPCVQGGNVSIPNFCIVLVAIIEVAKLIFT